MTMHDHKTNAYYAQNYYMNGRNLISLFPKKINTKHA